MRTNTETHQMDTMQSIRVYAGLSSKQNVSVKCSRNYPKRRLKMIIVIEGTEDTRKQYHPDTTEPTLTMISQRL